MLTKKKIYKNKKLEAAAPLLLRTAAFLVLFILLSGIIGPRIISHGLVNKYGFQIYGGGGKSLLFGVIVLLILVYRKGLDIKFRAWEKLNIGWLIIAVISALGAWNCIGILIAGKGAIGTQILTNLYIIASIAFIAIGTFGLDNIKLFYKKYSKELIMSFLLCIAFYGFIYIVYKLWGILALIVLHSVKWLLNETDISASIVPPRTLVLSKFGIEVAKYCSGIESIALFSGLYAIFAILDWNKFNHRKLAYTFPIAVVILFGLNIIRIFVLIIGGYYINPQIAFSLFHTYAGMVFFIIYSGLFWGICYKWLLVRKNQIS